MKPNELTNRAFYLTIILSFFVVLGLSFKISNWEKEDLQPDIKNNIAILANDPYLYVNHQVVMDKNKTRELIYGNLYTLAESSGLTGIHGAGAPKPVYKLRPHILGDEVNEVCLTQLPDGNLRIYFLEGGNLFSRTSADGGHTWSDPALEIKDAIGGVVETLVDSDGEIHHIVMVRRYLDAEPNGLRGPGATIMIDLWHRRTTNGRRKWEEPKRIFKGYCGAVLDFKQLRSGRLIVPFGYWVAGRSPLPTGQHISTVVYSDDNGVTWHMSESELTSPTYAGYNGNNYGACEPVIVELEKDGHLQMYMRTQTGFLYESFSHDNGTTWYQAKASRFQVSSGPPLITKLDNDRIFLVWNNCELPPRHNGDGVYGGRDAIHAAISDDNGKTWVGFREIHRDPLRHETPPHKGDRGTAYANSPILVDGKIMLITGMGVGRRHIVEIDPDWLTATRHETDFSNKGLEDWTYFKHFGPVSGWWRDRVVGPRLIEHPSERGMKVLHIRRPDKKNGDGAVWNFPNGRSGKLSLRIMLNEGFKGGSIALTDRFFNPTDSHGERLAMFSLPISAEGQLGQGPAISPGQWHTLDFVWDINTKRCEVLIDGKPALTINQANETLNGLSYLRLRSKAPAIDKAGYYIESARVDIDDNVARRVSEKDKLSAEANYRSKLSYDDHPDDIITEKTPEKEGKITSTDYWIHENTEEIPGLMKTGPFIRLADGSILTVSNNMSCISNDEGKTWTEYPIFDEEDKIGIRGAGGLIQTRSGVVIISFSNHKERANWNWQESILDSPGATLPTYVIRSFDGGQTWEDPQKMHDEWTGANMDIIETRDGSVVFTSMMMRHNPGRHTVVTYTSKDDGENWIRSNVIDLGGIGHHGGVTESILEQLDDGRLWMLMRTNWGVFWETYSDDEGLTWKNFKPTNIDASSAPGMLKRLESGRLVLVWNRYYPEGKDEYPLRGGDGNWSEVPVSNHREELSIMFSNDDGKSWSIPVVIARVTDKTMQLSYPRIFEAKPGELWITTTFAGNLRIKIYEKDFIEDERTEFLAIKDENWFIMKP